MESGSDREERPVEGATAAADGAPRWVDRQELDGAPALQQAVRSLVTRFGRELSVAIARTSLAPHLFIAQDGQSVFFVNRRGATLFAFAYAGPNDSFVDAARELYAFAEREKLVANILEEEAKARPLAAAGYSATPFGVMQTLPNLAGFTLEGSRMRRLRYQIQHYEKHGPCVTREYVAGSDSATDRAIAGLVDAWTAGKKQVGPYVEHFRREIAAGKLPGHCRLFLTCRDGQLDSAIVISKLAAANGYLMDLEFYGADMPLGGLEFAITQIQRTLAREGVRYFSLGATFGTQLDACADEDARVGKMLRGWHGSRIFNNDGNFQFKNKFRPDNTRLYICRPRTAPAATFTDVLMIFADPENRRQNRAEAGSRSAPASAVVRAPKAPPAQAPATDADARSLSGHAAAYRAVYSTAEGILADHVITGRSILPAASMVDLAVAAVKAADRRCVALKNVVFGRPGIALEQLVVDVKCRGSAFTIYDGKNLLCTGRIEEDAAAQVAAAPATDPVATGPMLDARELYIELARLGYRYGAGLQVMQSFVQTADGVRVKLAAPNSSASHSAVVDPALLDGAIQAVFCLLHSRGTPMRSGGLLVPAAIRRIVFHGKLRQTCWVHVGEATLKRQGDDVIGDLVLTEESGERLLSVEELLLKHVPDNFLDKFQTRIAGS
ncbi:MAG: phosphatidylglycerol lysyltransferase domain-containing protein [Sulfurifustis sp.]